MNRVTIINGDLGDDTVFVDGRAEAFSLEGLIDDDVWAVQWYGSKGEIEYRNGENQEIDSLDDFLLVLDEYAAVCDRIDNTPLTPEQLAFIAREEKKARGFEYKGITVPVFNEDATGALQIAYGFEDMGMESTIFHLSNGEKLTITMAEWPDFKMQFFAARAALFNE